VNVLAGAAVYENELRAERILAGQTVARIRGIRWRGSVRGRGSKMTGGTLVSTPSLGLDGRGIAAIGKRNRRPAFMGFWPHGAFRAAVGIGM
jgi:hypothetical protein